jgi:putative transposase
MITNWPHAPMHYTDGHGIYMITAGTYHKQHYFNTGEKLSILLKAIFACCTESNFGMQAWSVLSNHYHFVVLLSDHSAPLKKLINKINMTTARAVNEKDGTPGRRVWFQYWDSKITYEKSYLARLNYINNNPVHHNIVKKAVDYPYCSAAWFENTSDKVFCKTVASFKTDKVNVIDDF